jgi:hypothetical protein
VADDLMDDRRCTAKAKGSGERCKRPAIAGGTVCAMHGGSAPQVREKAQERQLEAGADQALRKLWVGMDQATPIKDPVAAMERLAGSLEAMVEAAGERVSALKHLAGGEHLTQLRAEVVLLERALGHLRALLVDMARLGLAERQVELQQEQAQLVTSAFLGALAAVSSLLPADRDVMLRTFLAGLGRGPELLEVTAS